MAFHPNTLQRALLNLVQNALDAIPSGGTLTLTGQSTATQVQLSIQDTGSGIPVPSPCRGHRPIPPRPSGRWEMG